MMRPEGSWYRLEQGLRRILHKPKGTLFEQRSSKGTLDPHMPLVEGRADGYASLRPVAMYEYLSPDDSRRPTFEPKGTSERTTSWIRD